MNGSISMNLDGLLTRTTVSFQPSLPFDELIINGHEVTGAGLDRVSYILDIVRGMAVEPLVGKRRALVTDRRTHPDFAELLRCLSDEEYPEAEIIVLLTDHLNAHSPACLYERFEPTQARRLAQRFEWHYTPEPGSGLNIPEIEVSGLSRPCTHRRISNKKTLATEVPAWEKDRNNLKMQIDWQFTTQITLPRHYCKIFK